MPRARRDSGFSLPELVLACSLLVLVMTGSFLFFRMGSRGFSTVIAKSGAVGDMQRATRILQREIEMSHIYSATVEDRKSDGFERDGLAVVALSSWSDPDNFEVGTQLPKWDRWSVFYATTEEVGHLYCLEFERDPPTYPLKRFADLGGKMLDNPLSVGGARRVTRLCDGVKRFSVEVDQTAQIIEIRLSVLARLGKRMTTNDDVEKVLDTKYEIAPANTYPEL